MSHRESIIFLFTNGFPFEPIEQHLQAELPYLQACFNQVRYVTTSKNLKTPHSDAHIPIERENNFDLRWLHRLGYSFRLMSTASFYRELIYLISTGKLTFYKLKTLIHYYFNALQISSLVAWHMKRDWNQYRGKKILFYSYWTDEKAIACILLKSKFKNSFAISRAHGWDVYEERHRENYLPWRNFIFSNLDHVFCISKNGFDYLKARYASFNKASVMRLGTKPLEPLELKKDTGIFRILSVSSVIPLKRIEKIVKALHLCVERIPDTIEWIHAGSGTDFDKIQHLANDLLKGKCVYEFKGQLSNAALRTLLKNTYFDIFINVSETEGLPVSIMEAMSASIPVIATDVGGTSEIVNEKNGWLVNKDIKDDELAEIICRVANMEPTQMELKRKLAWHTYNTQFNSEVNHSNFVDFLFSDILI